MTGVVMISWKYVRRAQEVRIRFLVQSFLATTLAFAGVQVTATHHCPPPKSGEWASRTIDFLDFLAPAWQSDLPPPGGGDYCENFIFFKSFRNPEGLGHLEWLECIQYLNRL